MDAETVHRVSGEAADEIKAVTVLVMDIIRDPAVPNEVVNGATMSQLRSSIARLRDDVMSIFRGTYPTVEAEPVDQDEVREVVRQSQWAGN